MDKPANLKSIIERCLENEIKNHEISVKAPSEISDNEHFYLISRIDRPHRGGNTILRIEENKKLFYFGPARISLPIVKLIQELRKNQYNPGNMPGGC